MITVNEAMSLQKAIKDRVHQLRELRSQVAVKSETRWLGMGEKDKIQTVEPQFDIKKVDKKITELEIVLYKIDSKIKQSNAKTEIEINADAENLLAPLE